MQSYKKFISGMPHVEDDEEHTSDSLLNAFVAGLRAPTHMQGMSNFTRNSKEIMEVALKLDRPGADSSHVGDRHHESNDSVIADHLNAHPKHIAALVHKDEGDKSATHVYDHKHNRFYKIHNGDDDDAIEQNADGSTGGVRGLKIKGSSTSVKEQAGAFVHHASNNPAPEHPDGKGIKRVLELNAATHHKGRELPNPHQEDAHKEAKKKAREAQKAEVARPPSMAHHPSMNGGSEDAVNHYHRVLEAGHRLSQEHPNIHARIREGYGKVAERLKADPDYDPRKDKELSSAARKSNKEHARSLGFKAASPRKFLGGNTKINKNEEKDDETVGMSNAPAHTHGMSGHNACPESSSECRGGCLGFATGKNAMLSNLTSKMAKSQYMAMHPEHHAHQVLSELMNHIDKVHEHNEEVRKGKKPGEKIKDASWRPNMYTDHPPSALHLHAIHNHVRRYAASKGINFSTRDYTKNPGTLKQQHPEGYHIAASSTGPDIRRG